MKVKVLLPVVLALILSILAIPLPNADAEAGSDAFNELNDAISDKVADILVADTDIGATSDIKESDDDDDEDDDDDDITEEETITEEVVQRNKRAGGDSLERDRRDLAGDDDDDDEDDEIEEVVTEEEILERKKRNARTDGRYNNFGKYVVRKRRAFDYEDDDDDDDDDIEQIITEETQILNNRGKRYAEADDDDDDDDGYDVFNDVKRRKRHAGNVDFVPFEGKTPRRERDLKLVKLANATETKNCLDGGNCSQEINSRKTRDAAGVSSMNFDDDEDDDDDDDDEDDFDVDSIVRSLRKRSIDDSDDEDDDEDDEEDDDDVDTDAIDEILHSVSRRSTDPMDDDDDEDDDDDDMAETEIVKTVTVKKPAIGGQPTGPIAVREALESEYSPYFAPNPKDEIKWDEPRMFSNCWAQAMLSSQYGFSPSCTAEGAFSSKQCYLQRCWCVNPDGSAMEKNQADRFAFAIGGILLNCEGM